MHESQGEAGPVGRDDDSEGTRPRSRPSDFRQRTARTLALFAFVACAALPSHALATVPTATTEPTTGLSPDQAVLNATINPNGASTAYQFEYTTAEHFAENGYVNATKVPATPKGIGSGTEGVKVSEALEGLDPRTRYRFRVVATNASRTVYGAPTYKSSFGAKGTANGQFQYATDVAIDPTDGTLWIADDGNERIQHFSAAGEYLGKFTSPCPGAVEVDSKGDVYIACAMTQGYVRKYSDKGELLKQIAGPGSGNGQVRMPASLALDSSDNLWVADYENDRVQKFNAAGELQPCIGRLAPTLGRTRAIGSSYRSPTTRKWTGRFARPTISTITPRPVYGKV